MDQGLSRDAISSMLMLRILAVVTVFSTVGMALYMHANFPNVPLKHSASNLSCHKLSIERGEYKKLTKRDFFVRNFELSAEGDTFKVTLCKLREPPCLLEFFPRTVMIVMLLCFLHEFHIILEELSERMILELEEEEEE